ncbi:MAG: zinc ribbon domain-containing protein [Desulfobacterales bacterium]|nr:zinc ribbon domain-containing protein [Desulfobacterales bacterium]MDJ0886782.1 zinc ribbon domain-containing protein [Desulfobacterales bacterium]
MPIYEFRCLKCQELFEFLAVRSDDTMETKCPHCDAEDFERVMSSTNFAMGSSGGGNSGVSKQTRTCSGGNCTSYEIPGP